MSAVIEAVAVVAAAVILGPEVLALAGETAAGEGFLAGMAETADRKSTRLNSSH